jgi:(R,R)-butanediol dehydrogenase / meso-butanediol dehydrogenase / diacetyl reductase
MSQAASVPTSRSTARAPTWTAAVGATRPEGTVVSVAVWEEPVEMDLNELVLTERRTMGSIAYAGPDFPATIQLMADGRIPAKDLVTKRIDLDDIVKEGFEELLNNRDEQVKILVSP